MTDREFEEGMLSVVAVMHERLNDLEDGSESSDEYVPSMRECLKHLENAIRAQDDRPGAVVIQLVPARAGAA